MRAFGLLILMIAAAVAPAMAQADCQDDALGTSRIIEVDVATGVSGTLLQEGEVLLTFDDGPHPRHTRRVLKALEAECAPALFFLRGDKAARYPKHVRRIEAAGHQLGGHGWAHRNLEQMSPDDAEADIQRGMSAIDRARLGRGTRPGPPTRLFRYPFLAAGDALKAASRDAGRVMVWVDVDGADWTGNSTEEIIELIMARLEARGRKGIILLHDPFPRSARAVEPLLAQLKANDYRLVDIQIAPSVSDDAR